MHGFLDLALTNLTSPVVLFFALGVFSALMRSDLSIPEAVAKVLAIYLMMSIGFKGGVEVAKSGVSTQLFSALLGGIVLSALLPILGFTFLRLTSKLSAVDAAAVAAHYGSISIVTFVAATQTLQSIGLAFEGYMIAVAAVMETPAIVIALYLARRSGVTTDTGSGLWREVALNSSVVVLVGSFVIGCISGEQGMKPVAPFLVDLFRGILCLFILDMGLIAGRGLRQGSKSLTPPVIAFGIYMPIVSSLLAALLSMVLGLSPGGAALLITLAASASYIAVPAAMRLALPEAQPAIYLTMSLAITFPFNLTLGIPFYLWLAEHVT
jgi:uncharacterized protein